MKAKRCRVWVWWNDGQKTLFRGSQRKCREFKKEYTGCRKEDIYITEIE